MKWIEFAVYTTDMGLEPVCAALTSAGLEQLCIEESSERIADFLEHAAPQWDFADAVALAAQSGPCVKAYIADLPENGALLQAARGTVQRLRETSFSFDMGPLSIKERRMDEEDWANSWKRFYKPLPVGNRLLICPEWERETLASEQKAGREVLYMDPGMAFGTGAHHTTRMCLELLDSLVRPGDAILDIGCGSGILAIAALLLGAEHAFCADIDPIAERVVRENLAMNGLDSARCSVATGNFLADAPLRARAGGGYDIVAANIVAGVIVPLCPLIPALLRPGGLFLCSGIIDERAQEVRAALSAAGLAIRKELRSADEAPEGVETTGWLAFLSARA